jgi:hypothetical protein
MPSDHLKLGSRHQHGEIRTVSEEKWKMESSVVLTSL